MQNSLASIISSVVIHAGMAGLAFVYQPQTIKPMNHAEMVYLEIKEGPTPQGNSPIPKIKPLKKVKKKIRPIVRKQKKIAPAPIKTVAQKPEKESAKVITQQQESPIKAAPETLETLASSEENPESSFGIENGIRDARHLRQQKGNKPPHYPKRDRLRQKEGQVVVIGFVDEQGLIKKIKLESSTGSRDMNQNALNAFSRYRFEKGQRGWVRMPFQFVLKGPIETIESTRSRTRRRITR